MIDFRCGNAIDVLKTLPSNSVHCIITSPPYWGLRAYGTEPQIWLNNKEPCAEHQWTTTQPPRQRNKNDYGDGDNIGNRGAAYNTTTGNSCSVCGAWRGELGLEPTPELYVEHLTQIFREVWRVLRDDGTLWLNIGDSYWGGKGRSAHGDPDRHIKRLAEGKTINRPHQEIGAMGEIKPGDGKHDVIKPKDLCGIPWRVAFALQADGWYLRSDIIWAKPNPMPESVRDRPTRSHEYVFLFTKSAKYYYDQQAILEPANYDGRKDTTFKGAVKYKNGFAPSGMNPQTIAMRGHERWSNRIAGRTETKMAGTGYGGDGTGLHGHSGYRDADGKLRMHLMPPIEGIKKADGDNPTYSGERREQVDNEHGIPARNKRDVWMVTTRPFKEAHFATFPPDLIEPMVLAGTSARGVCPKCGAPWERQRKPTEEYAKLLGTWTPDTDKDRQLRAEIGFAAHGKKASTTAQYETIGWQPSCDCNAGEPIPATVLDPFGGAGTVALACTKLGRDSIYIDLKPEYVEMAHERLGPLMQANMLLGML